MVRHNTLGNRRTNGINLRGDSTTLDADADVEVGEFVLAEDEDWFKGFEAEGFRLD